MKICIFGAGAIGGLFGFRLAETGSEVSAVARGDTAKALRTHGWQLQDERGTRVAPVRVAEDPSTLGPQDLIVVAVKGPALESVASRIAPLVGPETSIVTAMNGVPWWFFDGFGGAYAGTRLHSIDPVGAIEAAIPSRQVVGCVVHIACSSPEPGVTRHKIGNELIIGDARAPAGDAAPQRALAVAELLRCARFDVSVSERIQRDIWYKLWGNMTMNPVSSLTGATLDRILDDADVTAYCLAAMREAAAIGASIGCPIKQSGEDRNAITRKLGAVKTSMLQDLEAKRPMEIDSLLTVVREIGERVGQPTPMLDILWALIRLQARVHGLYPT